MNAAEEQAKQERYANLSVVLNAITGSYVHELDIERIAPFLDEKYAKLDNSNYPIRQRALKIFLSGHKKSAKMADRIRPLTKAANPQVAELAMKALKAIDVESEDRLSQ